MKKTIYSLVIFLGLLITLSSVSAAGNSNGNKISCFDGTTDGGYNGTCVLNSNGALLNTVDGDSDPNNNYAGVYLSNTNLDGKLLSDVNKLSFSYSGNGSSGGSPRISIPIDEDGNGITEGYAFVDTMGCNDGNSNTGTLNVINDSTCTIAYGGSTYTNWAEFSSTYPAYRIATDSLVFIIVDQPGQFEITNVQLGKGPAKPAK